MLALTRALASLAEQPQDPQTCYALATLYYERKHYAAAISFYLRCAENTDTPELAYSCLLRIAECFTHQEGRPVSVRGFYKHAICLLPARPEAYYFLSRHYETIKEYVDAYMMAELGLQCAPSSTLVDNCGYPGRYGLIFQKAVAAWWWGKPDETRRLLGVLVSQHSHELDTAHRAAVRNNLISCAARVSVS
jgi:tetratricopeptide (TPR) repeat protein